jgi:hypothetical protein
MKKQKVFVVYSSNKGGDSINELNDLLDKGWRVAQVHTGNGEHTYWLVVIEEKSEGAA